MLLDLCQFVLQFLLAGAKPFLGGGGGFHLAFGSSPACWAVSARPA
jgi:hypothetical protein